MDCRSENTERWTPSAKHPCELLQVVQREDPSTESSVVSHNAKHMRDCTGRITSLRNEQAGFPKSQRISGVNCNLPGEN